MSRFMSRRAAECQRKPLKIKGSQSQHERDMEMAAEKLSA
jgi:hypothetical protein